MSNFTPEPWKACKWWDEYGIICPDGENKSPNTPVARVYDEADARLIAAAPEMYRLMLDAAQELNGLGHCAPIPYRDAKSALEVSDKIFALWRQIEGKD